MNKRPILIVIAGPNGSGKTSVTSKILSHEWVENCIYINPDNIAKERFGDWNSPEAVLNAAILSKKIREECLSENKSLIFETVLSTEEKIQFIIRAKEKGFFIRLFFINTESPTINAGRIAHRVMEGGHDVPISKIISRYSKSMANCCVAIKLVDRAYLYDNSKEYKEPQLLCRFAQGILIKKYHRINKWAKFIINQIIKDKKRC